MKKLKTLHNKLIKNTVKSYLESFNLKTKNNFLYKDDIVVFDIYKLTQKELYLFLQGYEAGFYNNEQE